MIDQGTIEKIFDAAEITEVVGEFVNLKKRGTNFLGLCPFHNEKTPSFSVSPSKGIYKCFGCGKGGNAVNFIMEHESLTYPEALRFLAKKYGIEVEEKELTAEQIEEKNTLESLHVVTEFAGKYFSNILKNHKEGKAIGLSYLAERGFREDIIDKFQLGYSLDEWETFTKEALRQGYKKEYLVKTGLSIEKGDRLFDRFSGRVIFPIYSLSGRMIGFGGRTLKKDKKTAKYLNSPESDIYHKSKSLYGIFHAKKSMVQLDKCYLVEGYTDVLSFHQSGIENVIASSGTSLTLEQVRLIKRFTHNITVIYDGDEAGIKASLRGIEIILEEGMNVKVVPLPEGEDPDSFAKSRNATALVEHIEQNEIDFILFKTRLLMGEAKKDPIKRASLISDIVRSVAVIPDSISRSVYIKECSGIMDIDEQVLHSETNKIRKKKYQDDYKREQFKQKQEKSQETNENQSFEGKEGQAQEKEVIRLLVAYGMSVFASEENEEGEWEDTLVAEYIIGEITHDELTFSFPTYQKIFEEYQQKYGQEGQVGAHYFTHHPDETVSSLCAGLLSPKYKESKYWNRNGNVYETEEDRLDHVVRDGVLAFKNLKIQELIKQAEKDLVAAQEKQDPDEINTCYQNFVALTRLKMELAKNLGERTIVR